MALLSLVTALTDHAGGLTGLRAVLLDVLSPGRLVLLSLQRPPRGTGAAAATLSVAATVSPEASEQLRAALLDSERQRRQLILENARLRNELRQQRTNSRVAELLAPLAGADSRALTSFTPVPARVIGTQGLSGRLRSTIVDAGAARGITRSELVVDGTGLLLDRGTDGTDTRAAGGGAVAVGDRVLAGAIVVGRVAKAGRWVSLVQPVTDREFSARVQLVRQSAEGVYLGAEALLQGTGAGDCEVVGVPYTEAVSVGDEVVTVDIEGVRGPRLYFGRVTQAQFLEGGQWQIRVQPAVSLQDLQQVAVVRLQLQPGAPDVPEATP